MKSLNNKEVTNVNEILESRLQEELEDRVEFAGWTSCTECNDRH